MSNCQNYLLLGKMILTFENTNLAKFINLHLISKKEI